MKKFEGILICTDLDGTLLKSDKTISESTLDAIEYFKNEGGRFTFITGRMPYYSADICNIIKPNAPIGCGGGAVYDAQKREYLWKPSLPFSVLELVGYVDERLKEIGIQVTTFEKTYFCKFNKAVEEFIEITKLPRLTCNYAEVTEPIAKVIFADKSEENVTALERLLYSHPLADDFTFIRTEKRLFEVTPKNVNKGMALLKIAELVGVDASRTIGVGDYNNDASMLKTAKIGIAVANAVPEIKEVADLITVSNDEDAVKKIIEDIDYGTIKI